MQRYINYIFFEVWCRAPKSKVFSLNLFDGSPNLKTVMTAFYYSDTKGAYFFYGHIERIFELFANLSRAEIKQFKRWHQGNNSLQKICANDPTTQLVRYDDIPPKHKLLVEQLNTFFADLYDNVNIAALKSTIGHIDDHYDLFMEENDVGKCPFCGINDLLSPNHTKREAYDHYLPKKLYPFNSINFHNLVPTCYYCNTSYKGMNDPAHSRRSLTHAAQRRKAFYPYTKALYAIELRVHLQHSNFEKLTPAAISLQFGPPAISDEIDTWKELYGIEERYKAKLCAKSDGKYWLIQLLDEWKIDNSTLAIYMGKLADQVVNWPYAECNFLKKPFFDACQRAGMFAPIQNGTGGSSNQPIVVVPPGTALL